MKKKLNNFRASLEFTEGVLTQKVENVAKPLDTIEEKVQKVYDYQQDADYIQDKLRGHSVITLPQNAQNVDPTPPSLFALFNFGILIKLTKILIVITRNLRTRYYVHM